MKKTIKLKKQKIIGTQKFINAETGEIRECVVIEKNIEQDFNFFKVWLMDLVGILEIVGNKKIKVINYIFNNLNTQSNVFIGTQDEISKKIGVSRVVVNQTFKILIESGLLVKRNNSVYMINPNVLVKGNTSKRQALLIEYNEIRNKNQDPKRPVEYITIKEET